MKERRIVKLSFDGASKGNPQMVGGGGDIINCEGEIEMEYFWNIGNDSNNMVEAYGIWQGIKQLEKKGVEEAIVFGDSQIIIHAMNEVNQSRNLRLDRLIKRIKSVSKTFRRLEFYHVLWELNDLADNAANKAIGLGKNELSVNLHQSLELPP